LSFSVLFVNGTFARVGNERKKERSLILAGSSGEGKPVKRKRKFDSPDVFDHLAMLQRKQHRYQEEM